MIKDTIFERISDVFFYENSGFNTFFLLGNNVLNAAKYVFRFTYLIYSLIKFFQYDTL